MANASISPRVRSISSDEFILRGGNDFRFINAVREYLLKVSAAASDIKVKADVTQAESKSGTAVVKFDNNGVVKTYHVVFASK